MARNDIHVALLNNKIVMKLPQDVLAKPRLHIYAGSKMEPNFMFHCNWTIKSHNDVLMGNSIPIIEAEPFI